MQNKEIAFILKRFLPQKQKLSILCLHKGKIEIITKPADKCTQLWPGMLIEFHAKPTNKTIYFAENVEIILTPQENPFLDIHQIHHFLEICYYFVPLDSPCPEIFTHLYHYYLITQLKKPFLYHLKAIQKIYILKLLQLLGFYTNSELAKYLNIYEQLTSRSVDFDDKQKVESLKRQLKMITNLQIKKIDNWILNCLNNHPYSKLFKTIDITAKSLKS